MSYSPYADVTASPSEIEPSHTRSWNNVLEPGQLDQLVRTYKMVTLLIKPILPKRDLEFHADDEFDDENLKTLIHFIDGKFHHGLGDSAGSYVITRAFKHADRALNWDEFLTNLLTSIYGSPRENIDRIANSLE